MSVFDRTFPCPEPGSVRPIGAACCRYAHRARAAVLLALLCLGLWVARGAQAAPRHVEPFDVNTWALLADVRSPTVVVFTTTDCAHCPAVLAQLAREVRTVQRRAPKTTKAPKAPALIAVVMDATPGEADAALLSHPPYRVAHRLFAFDGQANALRYAVNPAWPGVTPYVALLAPGQPPRFVMGQPSQVDWAAWRRVAPPR